VSPKQLLMIQCLARKEDSKIARVSVPETIVEDSVLARKEDSEDRASRASPETVVDDSVCPKYIVDVISLLRFLLW
jgi:hypothetical protein